MRDAGENYKNILLGFMYAGVPSINSLTAVYNFQVSIKPKCCLRLLLNISSNKVSLFVGQTLGLRSPLGHTEETGKGQFSIDRADLLSQS